MVPNELPLAASRRGGACRCRSIAQAAAESGYRYCVRINTADKMETYRNRGTFHIVLRTT